MIPENELGVIAFFAQESPSVGFEIVKINSSYPDAIVKRGNIEYRVEFEFAASNFKQHKHDPRDCDLIICWTNDYGDSVLPILALSEANWQTMEIVLPTDVERECAYWRERAFSAEKRAATLEAQIKSLQLENDIGQQSDTNGDIIPKLFSVKKQERILAARQAWPHLSGTVIAAIAECSPSYVSEVLKDEPQGDE